MTKPARSTEPLKSILEWEGRLSNSRLQDLFGIKTVRVSEWVRELREEHPRWLEWESTTKSFVATWEFRSRKNEAGEMTRSQSLEQYLSIIDIKDANDGSGAVVLSTGPTLNTPDPKVFSAVNQAIRAGRQIRLQYRSMQQPVPHTRILCPHSIVRADRGWLVRAWCAAKEQFRDYRLNRMSDIQVLQEPTLKTADDDTEWSKIVQIRLMAHPALSPEQQELVRFEFFSGYPVMARKCRASLVPYWIQEARVATDLERDKPPQFLLAIENGKELKKWLLP